jgi:hypothetical protein
MDVSTSEIFENSKYRISKYVNFKQIFETLKTSNKKLINIKHLDQIDHYNFGINYVNILGRLGILNFKFPNL